MNAKFFRFVGSTLVAGAVLVTYSRPALAQNAEPPAMPSEELPAGSEVLTGGPVHEAFAKPVTMDAQAPIMVTQQPPENLQEVPPDAKPDGADIVWVPGYWAWDDTRHDFIWVSGCWRNAPPHTYWVPGYWLKVNDGWEWIGGFWKPVTSQPKQEIEYLPAPPAPIEVEAEGPAPLPDQVWVPGCWYWEQGQFVRRHGYWITQQVGWVWIPSHYAWTPRGYIFCQGHWDHDLDNRGVLFCPTYFPAGVRVRAGFVFSPGVCVDLGMLRLNLFACPRYRHYYFGDYYDDSYRRVGIYPWYKCQTIHTWYDPIFVYDRWHYRRTDPHWASNQAREFELRRSNHDLRPARTYVELQAQMSRLPANRRPERPLVQSLKTYSASQSTPIKFERISTGERQKIAKQTTDVRTFRDQRNHWESPTIVRGTTVTPPSKHEATSERRTSSKPEVVMPVTRSESRPTREVRQPDVVPPHEVRVTKPERVTVPSTPDRPRSSESRYIPKEAPTRPSQESYKNTESSKGWRAPDKDSKGQSDSQGRDRRRY